MINQYVCHAFGRYFKSHKGIFKANLEIKFKVYEDLSIISVMNNSCYEQSYIAKQCEKNNVNLIVPKSTFNISSKDWVNTMKIDAIVEELEHINTKYVMILDGKDTCILKDLDEEFISKFEDMDCDIVYNCQKAQYPGIKLETEEFVKLNHNKYINAGLCLGYKDKLLQFYQECKELNKVDKYISNYNYKPSEQYIVRKVVSKTNLAIRCDYDKILFTDCITSTQK